MIVGTHAHLIIADDIDDFLPSPEILTLDTHGSYRLTRHPKHDDFAVWFGGLIVAQGGRKLMQKVFKERTK